MSKFKCTSATENEIANGPLIFYQLEAFTNAFVNEILDMQQEFKTKAEFVNEQFLKSLRNEQEIENISNLMLRLQQQFTPIEIELQTLESSLQRFKDLVKNLEIFGQTNLFCVRNSCGCNCCQPCQCRTQRQDFLELLQHTQRNVAELPQLLANVKECRALEGCKNPYTDIFAILNCHCEALKNTEKNMDIILDKMASIQSQQLSLKNRTHLH